MTIGEPHLSGIPQASPIEASIEQPLSAGSTALPFVISTEAKRSGEISAWMLFPGNVFRQGIR